MRPDLKQALGECLITSDYTGPLASDWEAAAGRFAPPPFVRPRFKSSSADVILTLAL